MLRDAPWRCVRLRRLHRRRDRGRDLPRHRAQQAPRLSQPARVRASASNSKSPRRRRAPRSESHDRTQQRRRTGHATNCACRRSRSGRTGDRTLYSFAVDGKKLPLFAAVSRVKRDAEHQSPATSAPSRSQHIRTIRRYLETADAVLPNALVVAFDSRVRFEPVGRATERRDARWGT